MPDQDRSGGPGRIVLLFSILVVAAALALSFHYRGSILRVLEREEAAAKPAFSGASTQRLFLTPAESAQAASRGLVPDGARSIIKTGGALQYGQWKWDDQGVPQGPLTVRVNLRRQLVSVFRGADEIGTAVVVYGIGGKDSPVGKLPILRKVRDYHSITYDAPMPFSLFIRNDGVAVHGSPIAADKATNGCIGLPVGFAEKLFEVARVGDIIEIRDGD